METEKTLTLMSPIMIGNVEYTELVLVEPTAGQLSKAAKAGSSIDSLITLVQLVAKVPRGVVEQMLQRDFEAAVDFLGLFGSSARTTSEMSAPS